MAKVEKSIDVNVPVSKAYNQWTQFESFPQFMEGVKSVMQLDDKRLRWRAEIGGNEQEWVAERGPCSHRADAERQRPDGATRRGPGWRKAGT